VVSSTDFDSDCIKTLKMNELFENSEVIEGDLHQIESSVLRNTNLRNNITSPI
jgi:DNA (cytosine-5)-methyltransferase 1